MKDAVAKVKVGLDPVEFDWVTRGMASSGLALSSFLIAKQVQFFRWTVYWN